jgi:hypothetical protein
MNAQFELVDKRFGRTFDMFYVLAAIFHPVCGGIRFCMVGQGSVCEIELWIGESKWWKDRKAGL